MSIYKKTELYAAEYKSERSSWRYEQRDDVHARLGRLNARWSALSEALVEKRAVLEDALARWLYIEETQLLHGQYKVAHSQLCAWAMAKEAFLGAPVTIASVSDARYHLSTLGEFDTELRMVTDASLKTVQSLNVTILARKYASERSTYVYEDRVRLLEEDTLLKTRWGRLGADSAALRLRLDEALALEERKEALRLEYAFSASTFERFATDTIALVGMDLNEDEANPFGSTLVEVEAAGVVIEQDVGETTTRANALEEAYSRAAGQLKELGETPTSNPYTSVVLEDLMAQRSAMNDALDAREDAFDVELDRHLRHDALCEKFARTAVPLVDKLDGAFKMLTGTGTTPEEQLARVDELLGSAAQDSAVLPRLTELQREMDEIGVGVNVHTTLSGSDVQARWDQHRSLILQKGEILKQEIEYKQLRGVTKEQFDEIGNIFAVYDRDRSGYIDHKELKACLFSCGEEKTRAQIAEYIRDYGVDGKIAFERFQELMINLLGDLSDTESSLMDGFVLLANGRKTISDRVLLRYVDNDDLVAYFCRVAPRVGEAAYDYARWVQQTQ